MRRSGGEDPTGALASPPGGVQPSTAPQAENHTGAQTDASTEAQSGAQDSGRASSTSVRASTRAPARLQAGARVGTLVALVLATAASALVIAPAYADPMLVRVLLCGWAVAAVLVTAGLSVWLSAAATLLLGVVVALGGVAAMAALLPGTRQPDVLTGMFDALLHSGARILTTALPTPVAVDTLALPALAIWLAGSAATLALRARRPLPALLGLLLALTGAVVLNGPEIRPSYLPTALFASAAVVLLAVTTRAEFRPVHAGAASATPLRDGGRGGGGAVVHRTVALGLTLLVVATLTSYVGPLSLYGSAIRPADPRDAAEPPVAENTAVNPLSYLARWAVRPWEPLLTVTSEEPVELRWVVLSEFTGVTWLPPERFQRAGEVLPEPAREVSPGPLRAAEVQLAGLPGDWLPAVGVPRRMTDVTAGFDAESGTVRAYEDAVEGTSYTVTGQVPEWPEDLLREAEESERGDLDRFLNIPDGAPEQIGQIAAAFDEGTPYERANRLAAYLRENYGFDPKTPGGHGYANLAEFLVPPGEAGEGGTSEQFASAFALLAREMGLPSRVVVGFGPGEPTGVRSAAGAEYRVRTGDAVAWGEVYLDGLGWVPFDVTPGERQDSEESGGAGAEAAEGEEITVGTEEPEADPFRLSGPPLDVTHAWAALGRTVAGAVTVLALVLLLAGVVREARRRHRFGVSEPERRVRGAWAELTDSLRLAGSAPVPANTAAEVLARADALLPPDVPRPEWTVGATVNAVGFTPEDEPVTAAEAERAVDEVRTYVAAVRSRLSPRRRLLWWVDPRPLFWRRRGPRRRLPRWQVRDLTGGTR